MKKDYIGYVLAIVATLIGIYVSWYYYDKSIQFRQPIFGADFFPQTIYDARKETKIPLRVTRIDGTPLAKSVYSANHLFWNAGNLAISSQDVLTPLRISILGSESELLSVSIASQSRKVVDCKVTRSGANGFVLTFRILEQRDGCLIHIFYSGPQSIKYEIAGDIVGVKAIVARTETAMDFINREQQRLFTSQEIVSSSITVIPWALAVVLVLLSFRERPLRIRLVGLASAFSLALILLAVATHFDRQLHILEGVPSNIDTQGWMRTNAP